MYSFLFYPSSFLWSILSRATSFLNLYYYFFFIAKITPVTIIEIMFLFNRHISFLFLFLFFSNYTIFYFNISSGTILLRTTFFLKMTCPVDLFVPPDNTYVQKMCITK